MVAAEPILAVGPAVHSMAAAVGIPGWGWLQEVAADPDLEEGSAASSLAGATVGNTAAAH
jgi:hypothetical protein